MENRKFNRYSRIAATVVLLIASYTYLSTMEPTTSFWDCGEFIASSYKLEVGHPPGNPVFQLFGRFFSIFTDKDHAAMAINTMSALCSAFTILFLYLTIVHLGRRIYEKGNTAHGRPSGPLNPGQAVAVLGAGIVGSLAYCWSDTFWFSAVEGEVYAMSSLFTAVVFWAMLKWEEQADEPYANRWIILIALLMGLSVGVHLLNLLTIPSLTFVWYYRKVRTQNLRNGILVFLGSAILLAVILYGIIPYLPRVASWFDLLFVNVFGLGFNSGAVFFLVLLLALCFFGLNLARRKDKVLLHTGLLSFLMIVIGYLPFAIIIIRSSANTPTNEYQPDNPFTLIRYLSREQYGSNPLVYGETYASIPVSYDTPPYYTPLGDRYYKAPGALSAEYASDSKMLFPRMWSRERHHVSFYKNYVKGNGHVPYGGEERMPTMRDNLAYFFDYQINWMYTRYFMWNFAGRQNDLHGQVPGDPVRGNWESGIGFIDRMRLGDQSEGPGYITDNASKNHYYMLPLLLGLIGLFFQFNRDRQNGWITMLLFLMTGLAIVVYLNQPPYQVRERDYAYAGSFYAFSIWIGLAVPALCAFVSRFLKSPAGPVSAAAVSVLALLVPVQMAGQNWDDHDRSGRYTARDMAYNYFASTDPNAILVTHGDNDTFPLWYLQEVEEERPDLRVVNTSLLGTDWYIDQMKRKMYDSEPLPITTERKDYLYGTNEFPPLVERFNRPIPLKDAIALFQNPKIKINYYGEDVSYFAARKLTLPVNKENVIKYGIVPEKDRDLILDTLTLVLPESRTYVSKVELILLDMLAHYDWDRPVYFLSLGGELEIGIRDYLAYDGFAYKFVPIKSRPTQIEPDYADADRLYHRVMEEYRWESLCADDIHIDYQNLSTFPGLVRPVFTQTAAALFDQGKKEECIAVLDRMQQVMRTDYFPLNTAAIPSYNEYAVLNAIGLYYLCGETEKARTLADAFADETALAIRLFSREFHGSFLSFSDLQASVDYYYQLMDTVSYYGDRDRLPLYEEKIGFFRAMLEEAGAAAAGPSAGHNAGQPVI